MAAVVDLTPNKDLINPNFDHYQLSLDATPSYYCAFEKNIDTAKPSETSFSSHHAKLFSLHNHLFSDPWNDPGIYLCDRDWNIKSVSKVQMGKVHVSESLYQVPDASNLRLSPSRLNVSLSFPSPNYAVVTNGVNTFYVLETGQRKVTSKWKVLFSKEFPVPAFQLLDSVFWSEGENLHIECLVASVEEVEGETKEKHKSPYITVLSWITLASVDGKSWSQERKRRFEGPSPVSYVCLEPDGTAVHIVSRRLFQLVEDSVKPVETSESWEVIGDDAPSATATLYTWSQTASDLAVHLTIPEGLTKASLNVTIKSDSLEVGVKNGIDMIKGRLPSRIETDASTWTLEGRRLEISLQKVEEEMWSTVVEGDMRGELVLTPQQIEAIHERLAHLTSENWNDNPELADKPYNSQMLEECDALDGDGVLIMRFDGESHKLTHKVIANTQFLFSVKLSSGKVPAFCLRHDVDGFLWQASGKVTPDSNPWTHVGVLNAFGYVLASKERHRFCTCSPDMSVAVIADSQRHVYLYRQRVSVNSPLRNRKTGQQVTSVAKQQVLTLDCTPNAIIGLKVTNNIAFVATEERLNAYVINSDE